MILVNCDMGERGPKHPQDAELMNYIQVANLACGGHAGDEASISFFSELAGKNGVRLSAHLSYPDRENFGRKSIDLPTTDLLASLDDQLSLLPGIRWVKFHGALYNDSVIDAQLSQLLARWSRRKGITHIITFPNSAMARACSELGISVVNEVFAERRYAFNPETNELTLVQREKPYASIEEIGEALSHTRTMIREGVVHAVISDSANVLKRQKIPIQVDSVCVHSDSRLALELVRGLVSLCSERNASSEKRLHSQSTDGKN